MFKLVVLSALLAIVAAAPKPGYLAAAPLAYSSVIGSVPTAVSANSNTVVHSAALAAPAISYAAPALAYSAPVVAPAISTYSAHGLINGYGYTGYGAPLGYNYGYGLGLHGAALI